ncbi:hypothetical protein NECAME_07768 [Necator americanus]|uniref:Tryptophan-rich basic protein n=1 Tax=Necator americanus TaxID=51031 RepID=W2TPB5_NECAM|nr:hypothetical protein NECAME_07768 [Necator americanus]ETN82822.1 hypothetical protein NECAME_07768 [Necator americanus]
MSQCEQDTCLLESTNVFKICLVTFVALLFSIYSILVSSISNVIKLLMRSKQCNPEVLRLGNDVQKLRRELALISPTSEFSSYFKTERILKRTIEEYESAVAKEKMIQPSHVKIEVGLKVVAQAIGLLLLHMVSGIHAFCISPSIFWPFNFLLRFPSVWNVEGCTASTSDHTPVSMFVVAYCGIFTFTLFLSISASTYNYYSQQKKLVFSPINMHVSHRTVGIVFLICSRAQFWCCCMAF